MFRKISAIVFVCSLVLLAMPEQASTDRGEVGATGCRVCHPDQYRAWSEGPHSKAYSILDSKQRKSSKCLRCHTMDKQPHLQAVQCESCHGIGKYYAKDYIMKDAKLAEAVGLKPGKLDDCARCHNDEAPGMKAFDSKQSWKLLPHSGTAK